MLERALIRLLLRPSLVSGIACGLIVICMVAVRTWDTISLNPQIGPALPRPEGLATAVADTTSTISSNISLFIGQPWFYYILLAAVGVAVAVVVYVLLQTATGLAANVEKAIDEAHNSGEKINRAFGESFGMRLLIRFIIAATAVGYWQLTITVIVLFLLNVWDVGLSSVGTPLGWGQLVLSVVGLFTVLHIHVILLRLLFLRPRVFGGKYQILEALD